MVIWLSTRCLCDYLAVQSGIESSTRLAFYTVYVNYVNEARKFALSNKYLLFLHKSMKNYFQNVFLEGKITGFYIKINLPFQV